MSCQNRSIGYSDTENDIILQNNVDYNDFHGELYSFAMIVDACQSLADQYSFDWECVSTEESYSNLNKFKIISKVQFQFFSPNTYLDLGE